MSVEPVAGPGRGRRRIWFDPRFAIGLVLIVVSVVGVSAVVTSADRTTSVYAARAVIPAGTVVQADDLVAVRVRLGDSARRYLAVSRMPAGGLVASRAIGDGELIPTSAVGSAAHRSSTSVVVRVGEALAGSVVPGAVVDVWSTPRVETSRYGTPTVIVSSATVVRSVQSSTLVADRDATSLELQVSKSKVASVLEAMANGDELSVVPADTPLDR